MNIGNAPDVLRTGSPNAPAASPVPEKVMTRIPPSELARDPSGAVHPR